LRDESDFKPMLASGKVVTDYRPYIIYLKLAENINVELKNTALPQNSDFEYLKEIIKKGYEHLDDILAELTRYVLNRIRGDIAARAVYEVLNVESDPEYATELIAKILAGWIIEIGDNLGVIKLKGSFIGETD
jgi:hypothetical protein